jgi:hypothetical protein
VRSRPGDLVQRPPQRLFPEAVHAGTSSFSPTGRPIWRAMGPEHFHWPQNLALGVQLCTGARVRRLEPVIKRGPIDRPTPKA